MEKIKKALGIVFLSAVLLSGQRVAAQIIAPVKWSFTAEKSKENVVKLKFTAKVEKGWHLYSQYSTEGIARPTVFTFEKSKNYKLAGKTIEPKYVEVSDEFGTD
jgi:thiol:disulfide interchange protein DsbD